MPSSKQTNSRKTRPRPKSPSEIAPGVFVGGWNDALQFQGVRFCVLDEAPPDMPKATHFPIYDERTDHANTKNLDRLAEAIGIAHAAGEPVLVFCGHGVRRSPLAGAWYLRRSQGLPLDAAYDRIRAVRPKIEHAREWMSTARDLEQV
jgi:protein-tyrosine phosphatase